jgi:paraquat-inducible protein B
MTAVAADRRAAIGAFVLGGLILILGAVVLFGHLDVFSPKRRAAVVFDGSISGLSVGAPVSFRGVRVGTVEQIVVQVDPRTQAFYIPVTVQLEPDRVRLATGERPPQQLDLAELIRRGLRAELRMASFVTGESEIGLDFDPASTVRLHPGVTDLPEIPTHPSEFQRVTAQLSQLPIDELVREGIGTLRSIRAISTKLDADLPQALASVKAVSDGAGRTMDVANAAINDLRTQLDTVLGQLNHLASSTEQQVSQRGADLHTLLLSASQTLQQGRNLIIDLRDLTAFRAETRVNLEATLRDLAAAAAALRGVAADVEHNPQLLLTGRHQ